MKFLVTNDDGITAPGIRAVVETLRGLGEVVVVAPDKERSGTGHAITFQQPLRITETEDFKGVQGCFVVDGSPVDCVKIAIQGMGYGPDLVVSGINLGANLGTDVLYSGTVGAAFEAAILGFPALAVSLCGKASYLPTASFFLERMLKENPFPYPKGGVLNMNVPALSIEEVAGFLPVALGVRVYNNIFEKRVDPRGRPYYWLGGFPATHEELKEDVDIGAIEKGYVSLTPLCVDRTDYACLDAWLKKETLSSS